MPIEVVIPRLGWSMDEGTFVEWLKQDGELVESGDALFVLEGDKASQEIESIDSGILRLGPDSPRGGELLAVGTLLGYLVESGEADPFEKIAIETAEAPQLTSAGAVASPSVRRLAREMDVDLTQFDPQARVTKEDVLAASQKSNGGGVVNPATTSRGAPSAADAKTSSGSGNGSRTAGRRGRGGPLISPRAARVAKELGVDREMLQGSGRGGRIRERDVRAAAQLAGTSAASTPITRIRRTIAARMLDSHQTTAPVTLTTRADATNLKGLREQFKAAAEPLIPSLSDILMKLTAHVLQQHPALNARLVDDRIEQPDGIHIGLAVDTEQGLMVPVIRNVAHVSLSGLAQQSRELVEKARSQTLTVAELQGGTFTITNLGNYGIDAFTPIINPPQAAILGVGAIRREAVVLDDDRIIPREMITFSLTFDHRVVDGAPAARFLQDVCRAVENPAVCLIL